LVRGTFAATPKTKREVDKGTNENRKAVAAWNAGRARREKGFEGIDAQSGKGGWPRGSGEPFGVK